MRKCRFEAQPELEVSPVRPYLMRPALIIAILLVLGISLKSAPKEKPTLSKTPLTAEALEIYGTFLDSYLHPNSDGEMNLSDMTAPLSFSGPGDDSSCLHGIVLVNLAEAAQTIHLFGPEIARGRAIQIVNRKTHKVKDPGDAIKKGSAVDSAVREGFATGVFTLSEIAFDKTQRVAVFKFSFYCGSLCGQGGTIVFEKVGDKWVQSKRQCSSWVS